MIAADEVIGKPKKQVNILTSSGGLTQADLVPLNYIYEGPVQAQLTISRQAAQEIEVWQTNDPTVGDTPALGGASGLTIVLPKICARD